MDSSVPLLTRSSDYYEWNVKIIIFIKIQDILWVSNGLSRRYFEIENCGLNAKDAAFEIMKLALSPSMRYLSRSIKHPQEPWTRLDRTFGMINEDHNRTLERTSSTIIILDPKISASTLSDEFVQDEEEEEASTQSIQIEDNLLAMTPYPDALEVYEISDISYYDMQYAEEYIRISVLKKNTPSILCKNSPVIL